MYSFRRRPRMISTQLIAHAAALVVLVLLMDSPQTCTANEPLTYGDVNNMRPAVNPPPPPSPVQTNPPAADLQNPTASLPPPVLQTPPDSQRQQSVNPTSVAPPAPVSNKREEWADKYPATDFREDSVPPRFALWPDNLTYVKFVYFCQQELQPKRLLANFTYKGGEGKLQTRPYFDLGLVDRHNTPYFKRWRIDWRVDIQRISCPVVCEYTDLQRLYEYRLHRNVLSMGFGYGVAALVILELAVMVFIILHWLVIRHKVDVTEDQQPSLKEPPISHWYKSLEDWTDFIPDWVHLVLLVVVGFSMMEGAGHSNYFEWRSMLFYNTGVTYTYLTLFAMLSSFLYQCALFLQSVRKLSVAAPPSHSNSIPKLGSSNSVSFRTGSKKTPQLPTTWDDELKNSVKGGSDDWKYQRIFGQTGVLILMGAYLLSVDDFEGKSMDSLASVIVGAIIVACIWSLAVATIVAIRSLRCIFQLTTSWTWKPKPSSE